MVSEHLLATSCIVSFLDMALVLQWRSRMWLLAESREELFCPPPHQVLIALYDLLHGFMVFRGG